MQHPVYTLSDNIVLPDGTILANIFSNHQGTEHLSLGQGIIPAKTQSKIHMHPVVTQVTYVLKGNIQIKMKKIKCDIENFNLNEGDAIITDSQVSYQIINPHDIECHLLYIVNPSFIFLADENGVLFNDAVILGDCWDGIDEQVTRVDVEGFLAKREGLIDSGHPWQTPVPNNQT